MTPCGVIRRYQCYFQEWLVSLWYKAVTWCYTGFPSIRTPGAKQIIWMRMNPLPNKLWNWDVQNSRRTKDMITWRIYRIVIWLINATLLTQVICPRNWMLSLMRHRSISDINGSIAQLCACADTDIHGIVILTSKRKSFLLKWWFTLFCIFPSIHDKSANNKCRLKPLIFWPVYKRKHT